MRKDNIFFINLFYMNKIKNKIPIVLTKIERAILNKEKCNKNTEPIQQTKKVEEQIQQIKKVEEINHDFNFKQRIEVMIKLKQEHILSCKVELQNLRKLIKEHDFIVKNASIKLNKKKSRDFSKFRRLTGFAEPVIVSDIMYLFLTKTDAMMKDTTFIPKNQKEYDSWPRILVKSNIPVARTDITSHISKYIRDNNLQNPLEKREILLDKTLKSIFSEATEVSKSNPDKLVYTYLKLQKYINHHFKNKIID